jgi:hypothetical protein
MKHPILLPVGDSVQYRVKKDKMYVLDREDDKKEREYSVVSMRVREDVKDSHSDSHSPAANNAAASSADAKNTQ